MNRSFVPASSSPTTFGGEMGIYVPPPPPMPLHSTRGGDQRDVWVYDVLRNVPVSTVPALVRYDSIGSTHPSLLQDHREYAVFENGRLEAWGLGNPSFAVRTHRSSSPAPTMPSTPVTPPQ